MGKSPLEVLALEKWSLPLDLEWSCQGPGVPHLLTPFQFFLITTSPLKSSIYVPRWGWPSRYPAWTCRSEDQAWPFQSDMTLSGSQSVASVHPSAGPGGLSACCHPDSCWWGCPLQILSKESPVNGPATELCSEKLWVSHNGPQRGGRVGFCSSTSVSGCLVSTLTSWKRIIFTLKHLLIQTREWANCVHYGLSEAQMEIVEQEVVTFISSSDHHHLSGRRSNLTIPLLQMSKPEAQTHDKLPNSHSEGRAELAPESCPQTTTPVLFLVYVTVNSAWLHFKTPVLAVKDCSIISEL